MKLIDANAAIAECNNDGAYGYISAAELMGLPTIDLVRCGECKFYDKDEHCSKNGLSIWDLSWFCADGKRREDG